jgi:hypothetical protein
MFNKMLAAHQQICLLHIDVTGYTPYTPAPANTNLAQSLATAQANLTTAQIASYSSTNNFIWINQIKMHCNQK